MAKITFVICLILYTVDAIMDVKTTYQIDKNWGGDPCGPKNLSWQGLKCSYNNNTSNASFPRIVSL